MVCTLRKAVKEYDSEFESNGYEVDVDLKTLIEKIYVSSTASEYYKDIVEGI